MKIGVNKSQFYCCYIVNVSDFTPSSDKSEIYMKCRDIEIEKYFLHD